MILLTGATGFLGSALLQRLLSRGDEVVAIHRSTSNDSRIREHLGHPKLYLFQIDTHDPELLFNTFPIDTILHAATQYGRDATPLIDVLQANLILPLRLAELGAAASLKCFINIDSFFNKPGNSYSSLPNYSLSKKSLLLWLENLSTDIKIINVTLEHMYGFCDSPSKFVEHMIIKIARERVARVSLTPGHQRRDFIFLDDVVNAFMFLVDYGREEAFTFKNFGLGTGQTTQIRDFVEKIKSISKSPSILGFGDIPYRLDEIMFSSADISGLQCLGWRPTITVDQGIEQLLKS